MKRCYLFIDLFFISIKFWLSGCSSNAITPENPYTTVVLGHNSTNVEFRWRFTLKRREEITNVYVKRNIKYKGTTETFLVRFDVDRNLLKSNSSLYTFTHNYTQGSLSGYFCFTIKDITKQEDNTDGSKFRYLSDELSYLLETIYLNDPESRKESKIQLWILSVPRIFYLTSPLYANQGDSITLRCNASGHPAPRAKWTHKDTNTVIANSSVAPFNITGKASGGKYCCHVTNGLDATNCTSISVMEYQPINTNLETNVKFSTANVTFKVFCKAEASPPARYYIQQGNKLLRDNSSDGNVTIFTPVWGRYINISCIAKNKYGEGNPAYYRIPIYEPPSIVTHWDHPVTTNKTYRIFQCKATGIPEPNITWYNKAEDKVVSSENGELEVKNKECKSITLVFCCMAVNDAGAATTKLKVKAICTAKDKSKDKGNKDNSTPPSDDKRQMIIVVIVCVLLLLALLVALVLLLVLISRKRKRRKRDIIKERQQHDDRQNQVIEESPYGEPIDAIQVRSSMPASGSNADYATVEETGYRRVKTSNHLQELQHNKGKPTVEPVYAKVKKKKKKNIEADIPMDSLYAEIPGITPKVSSQNQTAPDSTNSKKEEDGVDSGEGSWFPWLY